MFIQRCVHFIAFILSVNLVVAFLFAGTRAAAAPPKWSVTRVQDWSPIFGAPTSSLNRNSVSGRMTVLAVSQDGRRLYAASTTTGIWRSSDRGQDWCQLNTILACKDGPASALPVTIITDIAVPTDPSDGSVVLAAAAFDTAADPRKGIYRSDDGGGHWSRVLTLACGGKVRPALAVEVPPDDATGRTVYAAGGCQIARSHNGGSDWRIISPDSFAAGGKGDITYLAVSEQDAKLKRWIYACAGDTFYYSRDDGDTWQVETPNIPLSVGNFCLYQNTSHLLATQPGQPNRIFMSVPNFGNGPRFFDSNQQPDGSRFCSQDLSCQEAGLFYGTFPTSGSSASTWTKLSDPPSYYGQGTPSGSPAVYTQFKPNRSGFFLFFSDTTTVHLDDRVPPVATSVSITRTRAVANSGWARLDGRDPWQYLVDPSLVGMFIHPDPHDMLVTRNFTAMLTVPNVCVNNSSVYCWNRGWAPGRGTLSVWIANDGGVYNFLSAGGGSWDGARGLSTLFFNGAAGIARHNGPGAALYTGATDNSTWWYNPKTGTWRVPDDVGDGSPYWNDARLKNGVVHSENNRTNNYGLFVAQHGTYPNPITPCTNTNDVICVNIAYPNVPTPPPGGNTPLLVNAPEMLPVVQTKPGESLTQSLDLLKIAPALGGSGNLLFRSMFQGAWQQVGPQLPAGAQIVQASGGHTNPIYYIGDANGQIYRSVYSGNNIASWPAISGADKNLCQATSFFADPYDIFRVYADDPGGCKNSSSTTIQPGIKLSIDGGATWNTNTPLETHLTGGNHYTHNCVGAGSIGTWAGPIQGCLLDYMLYVPGQPDWRFAMGITGVYGTADGGNHWQTLLSDHKMPCNATAAALDSATGPTPTLYVFCWGRGALRLDLQLN